MGCNDVSTTPVNTEHLTKLDKIDKDRFIASFLQGQHLYSQAFATEGRATYSTWNHSVVGTDTAATPPQSAPVGFDTPVLKPRPARLDVPSFEHPPLTTTDQALLKRSDSKRSPSKTSPSSVSEKSPRKSKQLAKRRRTDEPIKPTTVSSKKRGVLSASQDGDHAARLAERRERKRAKRAVVQPDHEESCESASDKHPDNSRKAKAKKSGKCTLPAGYALMHGFSATNVGKNRLTVKPQVVGVFNKGKASAKAQVSRKLDLSKAPFRTQFSEHNFLNKTRGESLKRKRSKSVVSSTESGSKHSYITASSAPLQKKYAITNRTLPKPRTKSKNGAEPGIHKEPSQPELSSPPHSSASPQKMASMVSKDWELNSEDFKLPSPILAATESVVLPTQGFSWTQDILPKHFEFAGPQRDSLEPILIADKSQASAVLCGLSSLAPSQSASQSRAKKPSETMRESVSRPYSKYFAQKLHQDNIPVTLSTWPILEAEEPLHFFDVEHTNRQSISEQEPKLQATRSALQQVNCHEITALGAFVPVDDPCSSPVLSSESLEREMRNYSCTQQSHRIQGNSTVSSLPDIAWDNTAAGNERLDFDSLSLSDLCPGFDLLETGWDVSTYSLLDYSDLSGDPCQHGLPSFQWRADSANDYAVDSYMDSSNLHPDRLAQGYLEMDTYGHSTGENYQQFSEPSDTGDASNSDVYDEYDLYRRAFDLEVPHETYTLLDDDRLSRPQTMSSLYADNSNQSEADSVGLVENFSQGALLLRLRRQSQLKQNIGRLSHAEEDVAKSLRGHWLPQKL